MNRNKFFKILTAEIKGLPLVEQHNALEFYKEYFNESLSEEDAISKLSHPGEIAKNLYHELGIEKRQSLNFSPFMWICIIITILLIGPAVIGLLVALFSLIVIVPGALAIAMGFTSIAGFFSIFFVTNLATALSMFGLSLLCSGLCMVLVKLTIYTFMLFIYSSKNAISMARGY